MHTVGVVDALGVMTWRRRGGAVTHVPGYGVTSQYCSSEEYRVLCVQLARNKAAGVG
jgi:hypothetical protein